MSPDPFVSRLADELERVVGGVLPRGSRCALLGCPVQGNPGDYAIWLGAKALLGRLGVDVVYECSSSASSFQTDELLARADSDTTVLLHGGGNFGDVWLNDQQRLRERALVELKQFRLVQLPQSIHFQNDGHLRRMQELIEAHGRFTIIVREEMSFEFAEAQFAAPVLLCPDLAFAMPVPSGRAAPDHDILWLGRDDREAVGGNRPTVLPPNATMLDWTQNKEPSTAVSRLRARVIAPSNDARARASVRRGFDVLRRGRVVVTDRLHGHILSILDGTPHVVLDNSYGKTRSMYKTWTSASPLATWADTADEALAAARSLVDSGGRA